MAAKRNRKDMHIDRETSEDTLTDGDLESAVVVYPERNKKIPLNMRIEPEAVELSKQIAGLKHLDGYTQLLRMYIWEGIERDRELLKKS